MIAGEWRNGAPPRNRTALLNGFWIMKRIICAALALTLLGSTAAEARGWGGGWHGGWHGDGAGVALGVGLGLLTLGAIAADSDRHYRDREDYYRERDAYERGRHDQDRADHYRGDDDRNYDDRDRHYDGGDDDGD